MKVIVTRDTFDTGEDKVIDAERGIIIELGDKRFQVNICGDDKDMLVIYSPYMTIQPLSPSSVILKSE